jgi:hypothetical protein
VQFFRGRGFFMTSVTVQKAGTEFDVSIVKDSATDESIVFVFNDESKAQNFAVGIEKLLSEFRV